MFGSTVIDVALGLAFVYLLLSMVCSFVMELISQATHLRARTLARGLSGLLADNDVRQAFLNHPLVKALGKETADRRQLPSYIPARVFSAALLDIVAPSARQPADEGTAAAKPAQESELRRVILALANASGGDVAQIKATLESWFDDVMDRASGWYKRRVQVILVIVAMGLTAALNVDTVTLTMTLWREPAVRSALADAASMSQTGTSNDQGTDQATKQAVAQLEQMRSLGVPIGWTTDRSALPADAGQWTIKVAGLLITALAASLGAPFWFDLVNKLVNLRSAGKVPPKSEEKRTQ